MIIKDDERSEKPELVAWGEYVIDIAKNDELSGVPFINENYRNIKT